MRVSTTASVGVTEGVGMSVDSGMSLGAGIDVGSAVPVGTGVSVGKGVGVAVGAAAGTAVAIVGRGLTIAVVSGAHEQPANTIITTTNAALIHLLFISSLHLHS
jgi:hypothetical protein